jgi:hypothetical protein
MKHDLFREKALKKMFSSQEINNYIKTSNLSMWLVFPAVAILLASFLIWGFCSEIRLRFSAVTVSENGSALCYIPENHMDEISDNTCVQIDGRTYRIESISDLPVPAAEHLSSYGLHLGDFEEDVWVYQLQIETLPEDGIYQTDVLSPPISPISLFLK